VSQSVSRTKTIVASFVLSVEGKEVKIATIAVLVLFVLWILGGFITAALRNTKKKTRAKAILVLSRLSPSAMELLVAIFLSFKNQDVEQANRLVASEPNLVSEITAAMPRYRDRDQSAGTLGDEMNRNVWKTRLVDFGYSESVASIIGSIFHHHLDGVLEKIVNKRSVEFADH